MNGPDTDATPENAVAAPAAAEKEKATGIRDFLAQLHLFVTGKLPDASMEEEWRRRTAGSENSTELFAELFESSEFRKGCLGLLAPELIIAAYRGVMGREPEANGLAAYAAKLKESRDLSQILSFFIASQEFRWKNFVFTPEEMVRAFHRGILQREPHPAAFKLYVQRLVQERRLENVLSQMVGSMEFRQRTHDASRPRPILGRDGECWVFLHISKTAGSSIQTHLAESFPPGTVYKEHADTLAQRPPQVLANYSVFAGHFHYDSLTYLARETISVFTFVRDPVARLLSYYYFRRAHEPEHHLFGFEMKVANELGMEEFFQHRDIKQSVQVWNHMTWAIMGQRQWESWKSQINGSADPKWIEKFVLTVAGPAIRRRLREFAFVGLQEDFDRGVKLLYKLLGKCEPGAVHADNTLAGLLTKPHFKKQVDKQPLTDGCKKVIESLVQLDEVVYDEAKAIYAEQVAGFEGEPGGRTVDV